VEVVASLSQGRTAAAQCGLFTYKSVTVIFEPPCKCCPWKQKSLTTFLTNVRRHCKPQVRHAASDAQILI